MELTPAPNINILSFKQQNTSSVGKFLTWSLKYGRIIIIVTELLVIGAFVSRFYFDAKLSDLHDQIEGKSNLIRQSQTAANQFLALQSRLNQVGQIMDGRKDYAILIANLNNIKPADMQYSQVLVAGSIVTINADVSSVTSLNAFLQQLNMSNKFANSSVDNVTMKDGRFVLSAQATVQDAAFQ